MLKDHLKHYKVILASGSPRRQQFFKDLNIDFDIRLKPVDEVYPKTLQHAEISNYLALLKAEAFSGTLKPNELLITSDTIVWHKDKALGKPTSDQDAYSMLTNLSNSTHEVITSICFKTNTKLKTVFDTTKVTFKTLSDAEIWHYIEHYHPMDKAGAYGIQEWIGKIAVTHIEGSYFNVMGLPTHLIYNTLLNF